MNKHISPNLIGQIISFICSAGISFLLTPYIVARLVNILVARNRKSGNRSSGTRKAPFLCLITCPFLWGY